MAALSCEEQFVIINCSDCLTEEPIYTIVEARLDRGDYPQVLVRVYEGNIEDNVVVNETFSTADYVDFNLKLNRKYTFAAYYNTEDGNLIIAVDSVFPRVKYDEDMCEEPCYYIYNSKVNLSLKNYGNL